MRHSVFAGGKRIRPILMIAAAEARGAGSGIATVGAAIECIHTYSLVHDDLPALDDDDLRRGKPTCHKVYGEAVAILAGDALLTLGLGTLAAPEPRSDPEGSVSRLRTRIAGEMLAAIGTVDGMIGGQVADIEAERAEPTPELVGYIHRAKTAALIRASVVIGSLHRESFDPEPALHSGLRSYGEQIGLAFQIVDDILDVVSSSGQLGKTAGKDERQDKATFPALYGVRGSRQRAQRCLEQALEALDVFGGEAWALREIARWVVSRVH